MNATTLPFAETLLPAEFKACFDRQKAAYLADPEPSHAARRADLEQAGVLEQ